MNRAEAFVDSLAIAGYSLIAGVPCSILSGLIEASLTHSGIQYIGAANEGDAIAIAAGAWLGGTRSAVFLQNSGLGNAVNPLTSLIDPLGIPLLMVIGWRGKPGTEDEPQHQLMGEMTPSLLRLCKFEIKVLGDANLEVASGLASLSADTNLALLVDSDAFRSRGVQSRRPETTFQETVYRDFRKMGPKPSRASLIEAVSAVISDTAAVFSTTGKCSRELFEIGDRPNYIYQVGSMGCVSSLALGFSLATGRQTVVLDGDGAALMRLGALATIGAVQPAKFVHVMLDNEAHESTGGQPTVSSVTDLAGVAGACGYARIARCDDRTGFEQALEWAFLGDGPAFIHAKISSASSPALGRPAIHPAKVARRFRSHFGITE